MLPQWYISYKNKVGLFLKEWFANTYFKDKISSGILKRFLEATEYGFDGGKRFRGVLAMVGYWIWKSNFEEVMPWAGALELIHAFSLVHDDMPELDNDTLRRWKPTVWAAYSDWEALLVGDNLMMLGFEMLSDLQDPKKIKKLLKLLSEAIGVKGMNGGQYMDVWYELHPQDITYEILKQIHAQKTWALIKLALVWWAIIAWEEEMLCKLEKYWELLGMAFQISDDILDVTWTVEETGKSVWWEQKWYVYFLGLEKTQELLKQIVKEWTDIANQIGEDKLVWLIEFMEKRKG